MTQSNNCWALSIMHRCRSTPQFYWEPSFETMLIFLLISVGPISPSFDILWNSERLRFVNCPSYTGFDRHHHSKRYLFEAVDISLLHLQGW
jgi:hypothetical protein